MFGKAKREQKKADQLAEKHAQIEADFEHAVQKGILLGWRRLETPKWGGLEWKYWVVNGIGSTPYEVGDEFSATGLIKGFKLRPEWGAHRG